MKFLRLTFVASLLVAAAQPAFASCADEDPDGTKVAAARAAVATECPCNEPDSNHGDHVSCAAGVANTRSGLEPEDPNFLPKQCKGQVKKCAARSVCGKPGFVPCCITKEGVTKCKTKSSATACTDKGGTVGTCASCCDACNAPAGGPSCPGATTTTTGAPLPSSTTLPPPTLP